MLSFEMIPGDIVMLARTIHCQNKGIRIMEDIGDVVVGNNQTNRIIVDYRPVMAGRSSLWWDVVTLQFQIHSGR